MRSSKQCQVGKTPGASVKPTPLADAERVTHLILGAASTSFWNAGRIVTKLVALSLLGFLLASNCCLSFSLVPIGVLMLTIAIGLFDSIREECSQHRFFPHKTLNSIGSNLFHWQTHILIALALCALSSWGIYERIWGLLTYGAIPLTLMLIGKTIEPYRFRRARAEVQKAEILLRQLVNVQKVADIQALTPLIECERIPLYKLGSVASLLQGIAAGYGVKEKLSVELTWSEDLMQPRRLLSTLLSTVSDPFRKVGSAILLWEFEDAVLYMVVSLYFASIYVGSFYFAWTPLCILIPFMGPKSKTGRYLRALQEDIRISQGESVNKKGGLTPAESPGFTWRVNWPMLTYIASTHLLALYALVVLLAFGGTCPFFGDGKAMKWETLLWAGVMYVLSGLGITAGVHRLWAHKTYKAGLPLRILLMIFNSLANQGCIFHWARDHRVHHLYSDTAADPHDATNGFWYSHVGWLIFKKNPAVIEAGKKLNLTDLYADPVVMFQKSADPFWNLLWCFVLPSFPALLWDDSFWNGFLLAGVLRYICMLNATWAVNSVVHHWGEKPYNTAHATTENGWVSFFALGEGWHNWHHAFDWDYAAAEMGALSQFNPTKVFIDVMAFMGLAWGRKRALEVWAIRKSRWEEQAGRPVLESIEGPPLFKCRTVTFGPALESEHHSSVKQAGVATDSSEE